MDRTMRGSAILQLKQRRETLGLEGNQFGLGLTYRLGCLYWFVKIRFFRLDVFLSEPNSPPVVIMYLLCISLQSRYGQTQSQIQSLVC